MKDYLEPIKRFFSEKGTRGKLRKRKKIRKEILKAIAIFSAAFMISTASGKFMDKYLFPSHNNKPVVQYKSEKAVAYQFPDHIIEEVLLGKLLEYHGIKEEVGARVKELTGTPARKKLTEAVISDSTRFEDYFEISARINGLDIDLIRGLAAAETGYLFYPLDARSPVGAIGLGQFMERAACEMDLEILKDRRGRVYYDERIDPEEAIIASGKYFREYFKGDIVRGLMCYNSGPSKVRDLIKRKNTQKLAELFKEGETRDYVVNALSIMELSKHPERYGLVIEQKELFSKIRENAKEHTIERGDRLCDLVALYKGTTIKKIKEANPAMRNIHIIPAERTIYIPQ